MGGGNAAPTEQQGFTPEKAIWNETNRLQRISEGIEGGKLEDKAKAGGGGDKVGGGMIGGRQKLNGCDTESNGKGKQK